ncbi:WD40 repeat-like protein [Dacryopinax primogenitus]|uniref:WD40 repeat-like protein n=1 Tax=Dacryopinax primogenitus (strain DJM 731) TaxID=1858805 RepID=M5GEE1_DACPD|nr:WD40 repeat-like protein [Dacryopinax primogenitus]EJU05347.1 WD40 repeat-like protein [Dacryopinax primogenitus]
MDTSESVILFRTEADFQLEQDRRSKQVRLKDIGDPIYLGKSKPLCLHVEEGFAWTGESNGTITKRSLETNEVHQVFRGHRGPVSAICVCWHTMRPALAKKRLIISGSWDKHIKIFDDESGQLLSDTDAHTDFIKSLTHLDLENIIVSGGSDKEIRFWLLPPQFTTGSQKLECEGFVREHTRPVVRLTSLRDFHTGKPILYSGDSMGTLFSWTVSVLPSGNVGRRVRATKIGQFKGHSTGITDWCLGSGQLWTSSSDNSVLLHRTNQEHSGPLSQSRIQHSHPVKALLALPVTELQIPYLITACSDEKIRVWDVSAFEDKLGPADLLRTVDAHSHEISSLALWLRKGADEIRVPWVLSASLDSTLRRWKLSDLLARDETVLPNSSTEERAPCFELTEEEERELLDLEQ